MTEPARIDLGCGAVTRPGFVGLDQVEGPGVDHVLDLTRDRYPFPDRSVDEVYSAHFLEHIEAPNHVFGEIARICKDGARIEFWTPYAFSDEAFLYGHLHFITEEMWMHFCVSQRDYHADLLKGRWQLHRIVYVVLPATLEDLAHQGVGLDFAIRYLKGVVHELRGRDRVPGGARGPGDRARAGLRHIPGRGAPPRRHLGATGCRGAASWTFRIATGPPDPATGR
jgi:SAM-dependent methyltransferase